MDKNDRDWLQNFSNALALGQILVSTLSFGVHINCLSRMDEINKDLLSIEERLNQHIHHHGIKKQGKNVGFLNKMGVDAYKCFPEVLY